jgi:hypothetical protein
VTSCTSESSFMDKVPPSTAVSATAVLLSLSLRREPPTPRAHGCRLSITPGSKGCEREGGSSGKLERGRTRGIRGWLVSPFSGQDTAGPPPLDSTTTEQPITSGRANDEWWLRRSGALTPNGNGYCSVIKLCHVVRWPERAYSSTPICVSSRSHSSYCSCFSRTDSKAVWMSAVPPPSSASVDCSSSRRSAS